MAILNPVVSRFTLTQGNTQEVYICPNGKTNAILDVTFHKEDTTGTALIAAALSTEPNPANLTTVDFFIDDIKLEGVTSSAELNKLIVGPGERLYIRVVSGPDIAIRLSGVEDSNNKVLKAGRLAASSIADTAQAQIYANTIPNVSYISASVTVFNTSNSDNADIEVWVSTSTTPSNSDKVLKINIPPKNTTFLENILLLPNERIFVKSSQPNTEYFVNGMVIGA